MYDVHVRTSCSVTNHAYVDLKSVEFDVSALGVRWFSRLFVGSLPYCAVLRIIDSFFFEGHVSLFRIALAIMSLGAEAICQGSTAEEVDETIAALMQQHTDPEYLVRVRSTARESNATVRE